MSAEPRDAAPTAKSLRRSIEAMHYVWMSGARAAVEREIGQLHVEIPEGASEAMVDLCVLEAVARRLCPPGWTWRAVTPAESRIRVEVFPPPPPPEEPEVDAPAVPWDERGWQPD